MILFADPMWHDLGVLANELLIGILLIAPAFLLGLLGVILGSLRHRRWAGGLGAVACLLDVIGIVLVCLEGEDRPGELAERLLPGSSLAFWIVSVLTLTLGGIAISLSAAEDSTPPAP
jgi:hypothetical protein